MYLLRYALLKDDFGLRQRFPWVRTDEKDSHIKTCISVKERVYLTELMEGVYGKESLLEIERIENPHLWGRYVLQYEEMRSNFRSHHVREQIMIHGTSAPNAYSIAENNFDWRLVTRCRFGRGVSFTSNAQYARTHATRTSVYIVAGVLVANSSPGDWYQSIPDNEEDTTTGYTEETCIKYNDNDFYPYYIIQKQT